LHSEENKEHHVRCGGSVQLHRCARRLQRAGRPRPL